MTKDEMLSKIKDKLKDEDYQVIEWCKSSTDCILLRKPFKKLSKEGILEPIIASIESIPIPLVHNRIVNVYELLYELQIIKL
jgi:hypothetical protein